MNKVTQLIILTELVRYLFFGKDIDDKEIDISINQEGVEIEFLHFGLICLTNNKISYRIFVDRNNNSKEKLLDINADTLRNFTLFLKNTDDFNEFIDDVNTLYNILKNCKIKFEGKIK